MSDRFKFRAWDKKSKKIREVSYIVYDDINAGEIKLFNLWGWNIIEDQRQIVQRNPNEVVLMQCTGHKDKNGKLIYEGDVVKYLLPHSPRWHQGEVIWDPKMCFFGVFSLSTLRYADDWDRLTKIEIIGNIY